MKKVFEKLILAFVLVLATVVNLPYSNNINAQDSEEVVETIEGKNTEEGYIESEIEKYTFDEDGKITGIIEDDVIEEEDKSVPKTRSSIVYGKGYLDFTGKSSQVLTVYTSANPTSSTAYTYFNTGSAERVATLSQSGDRIQININGYTGWINKTSYVTSANWIPVNNVTSSFSEYYTKNSSGALVYTYGYYETVTSMVAGMAPSFMSSSTKYYSLDGIYYYTSRSTMFNDAVNGTNGSAINKTTPFYNYYQYLPFRSTTNLTVADFKKYLTSRLSSDSLKTSVLNNDAALNQFFISEKKHSVNAALEYSMAILESGSGTSQIAQDKNNLFGWGAVDSGPYAGAFKFSSVTDGIDYHAKTAISSGYLDAYEDSRYHGGNVGNKNNGVNVKYASDPYWGMKIAGIYYSMDKQAGFKDYNYYKLAIQNKGVGSGAYYNGKAVYYLYNRSSKLYITNMPFVVVGNPASNKISVVSDLPICNTGDSIYNYYINQSTLAVGTRNYSCNSNGAHFGAEATFNNDIVDVYNNSFTYAGGSKTNVPGNGSTVEPVGNMRYVLDTDGSTIKYAYMVDANNKATAYYEYYSGAKISNAASKIKFVFNINVSNDTITNAYFKLDNNGAITRYYEYYSGTKYDPTNGTHGSKIKFAFYVKNDVVEKAYGYSNSKLTQIFEYEKNTKYGNHGSYITMYYQVNSAGKIYKSTEYNRQKATSYFEYYADATYANKSSKVRYHYMLDSSGYVTNATLFNTDGKAITHYEYQSNAVYGKHGPKIKFMFEVSPSTGYLYHAYALDSNWKKTRIYYYRTGTEYNIDGSHGQFIISSSKL